MNSRNHKINVAIVGIGNCASSLVQGIHYYTLHPDSPGLMHADLAGYRPENIRVVAAFDIDKRKVGLPLHEAVYAKPNCTKRLADSLPESDVIVRMGHLLDGVSDHMSAYPEDQTFSVSNEAPEDIIETLVQSGAHMLVNYLPVGSEQATAFYAECALRAGIAFVNCIPVFIGSDPEWDLKFKKAGLPLIGDDIKAQVGATIVHRMLTKLFEDRGVELNRTYQLNVGGNTDFLNMKNHQRLSSKKISKTEAVQSQLQIPLEEDQIHIGPSDYIPFLQDQKICYLQMEGTQFGGASMKIDLKLVVEDSPNSAGVMMDVIRGCKVALDRGMAGAIHAISAYTMKHPPRQMADDAARDALEAFIQGK